MNVIIEPLIDVLQKLWNGITMYAKSRPIQQMKFQFHAMLVWKIYDAVELTHFFWFVFLSSTLIAFNFMN